jgi:uncharacterized protein (DUF488 family)
MDTDSPTEAIEVLTIGHSTRSIEEFLSLLRSNHVTTVVDIRTVPRSRRNPQYNTDSLPVSLAEAGIGYARMSGLGGFRKTRPDSPNTAWRNDSFRGFADYMQTDEFEKSLNDLIELARRKRVVIMCAEAVPWQCHRSLIADALTVRGVKVRHIIDKAHVNEHKLTSFARVEGAKVTYPGQTELDME